jgi:hypothetical protein
VLDETVPKGFKNDLHQGPGTTKGVHDLDHFVNLYYVCVCNQVTKCVRGEFMNDQ